MSSSRIRRLPAGLIVRRDLNLSETDIASLPPGLKVRGDLDLGDTQISELPADLKVDGKIMRDGAIARYFKQMFRGTTRLQSGYPD